MRVRANVCGCKICVKERAGANDNKNSIRTVRLSGTAGEKERRRGTRMSHETHTRYSSAHYKSEGCRLHIQQIKVLVTDNIQQE